MKACSFVLIISLCALLLRVDGRDGGTVMGSRDGGTCGDGVTWDLSDGVLTISGNGKMTNYTSSVPWNTLSVVKVVIQSGVTSIGNHSFAGCKKMTTATIASSVTYIGDWAFESCTILSSITIPSNVEYIGDDAFALCDAIETITIPDRVTYLGSRAFNLCRGLTSAIVGKGVAVIGDNAFYLSSKMASIQVANGNVNFKSLNNVLFNYNGSTLLFYPPSKADSSYSIPSSVLMIGHSAFAGAKSLKSVTFPGNNLKTIEYSAFSDSGLQSITVPATVTSLGTGVFSGCSSLNQATLGSGISEIPSSLFSNCKSLTSVTIPSTVTSIGTSAFNGCENLQSGTVPDAVTTIGDSAFSGCKKWKLRIPSSAKIIGSNAFSSCSSIQTLSIPASTSKIGSSAFIGCSSLLSIDVAQDNKYFSSLNGVLFDKQRSTLLSYPIGISNTSYSVPESVTTIGRSAFSNGKNLISVTMSAVEVINNYGFGYCDKLETIILSDTLKTIQAYAFMSCESLVSVTFSDTLTEIENYAFNYCPKLDTVFYQGTEPFSNRNSALYRCSPTVCVSPDFKSETFCGISVSSSNETCETFRKQFNKCYKGSYVNGGFVQTKRKNATDWESQTTKCVEYVCDNSSGPVTDSKVDCNQPPSCHIGYCNESTGDCDFERIDGWQELIGQENECYEIVCDGVGWVVQKRKNATEWETQMNGCFDYICDNNSGLIKNNKIECDAPPSCHKSLGYCNETTEKCEYYKTEQWNELITQENECYEVVCDGNEWVVQKRKNVTEWEKQTNDCVEYVCENRSGLIRNNRTECNNPPDCYKSNGFCDEKNEKCQYEKKEGWNELVSQENECYEVTCDGNEWTTQKRKNATEWESQTNECFEYTCNNDTGRIAVSLCNSSVGVERMCVDGKCVEDKKMNDMKWSVEIEFEGEIRPECVTISELVDSFVSISGVDKDSIEIGIEIDDEGNIIRVLVFVNDEDTAMIISQRTSETLQSDKCAYGPLCRVKVDVKPPQQNLISGGIHIPKLPSFAASLIILMMMIKTSR